MQSKISTEYPIPDDRGLSDGERQEERSQKFEVHPEVQVCRSSCNAIDRGGKTDANFSRSQSSYRWDRREGMRRRVDMRPACAERAGDSLSLVDWCGTETYSLL